MINSISVPASSIREFIDLAIFSVISTYLLDVQLGVLLSDFVGYDVLAIELNIL